MLPQKEKKMMIVVFSSRNETLYFAQALRSQGYYYQIVNTPKEAGQACGISVKIAESLFAVARGILANRPFRAFVGIFRMSGSGERVSLERIL